jgi:glycerol-3-phosphate dehydrogenase
VKSVWVGLRPLVKPQDDDGDNTKGLSREHTVLVSRSGLVTVTGGKWTTYRAMAEDVLDACADKYLIENRPKGVTVQLPLVGADVDAATVHPLCDAPGLHSYGSEAAAVAALPGADVEMAPGLTEAMVRFAARFEYAVTVEDMLARRSRLLFLDARLAASLAPRVAALLQEETGLDPALSDFERLTQHYLDLPA